MVDLQVGDKVEIVKDLLKIKYQGRSSGYFSSNPDDYTNYKGRVGEVVSIYPSVDDAYCDIRLLDEVLHGVPVHCLGNF